MSPASRKGHTVAKRFCKLTCSCQGKKDRRGRSNFIGAIQADVPNTAHHFCSDCQTLWEHTVDDKGVVTRRKIPGRFRYSDEITILF